MTPGPPPPEIETRTEPWLRRSDRDKYLSGLAGGIARRFQFDPLILRVGLVGATTFAAYAGPNLHWLVLVPYFLGWILVPPAEGRALVARLGERAALQEVLGALVVLIIGLLVLADTQYAVAVGLGALALALFSDRREPHEELPPQKVAPSGAQPATRSDTQQETQVASDHDTPTRGMVFGRNLKLGERASDLLTRPEKRQRREPALWPLTLSLLVLLAIVSILIDRFMSPGMDPRVVVNLALLAIGSVLVLSFWRGRARITALWALALVPFWIAFSLADVGRFEGQGNALHTVQQSEIDQSELGDALAFELGYGDLTVDLRQVELAPGSETTLVMDLTVGSASVIVPRDVTVKIDGKVGLGSYRVLSPSYWQYDKSLANGEIKRTFGALGSECFQHEMDATEMRNLALRSGVAVIDVNDLPAAIEAAGFPRPIFSYTNQEQIWFESQDEGQDVRLAEVDYYAVQMSEQGQLCTPVDPPSNPATLVIQPTVGIGNLEINRVDVN